MHSFHAHIIVGYACTQFMILILSIKENIFNAQVSCSRILELKKLLIYSYEYGVMSMEYSGAWEHMHGIFAESMKYSWSWEYLLLLRAWRVHEHGIVMLWRSWRVHDVRSRGFHDINDHGEHGMFDDEIMKVQHTQDQMFDLENIECCWEHEEFMKGTWFQQTFHAQIHALISGTHNCGVCMHPIHYINFVYKRKYFQCSGQSLQDAGAEKVFNSLLWAWNIQEPKTYAWNICWGHECSKSGK